MKAKLYSKIEMIQTQRNELSVQLKEARKSENEELILILIGQIKENEKSLLKTKKQYNQF